MSSAISQQNPQPDPVIAPGRLGSGLGARTSISHQQDIPRTEETGHARQHPDPAPLHRWAARPMTSSRHQIVRTDEGTLVQIARLPESWLRTKTTQRHGTQCLLRRFQVIFPGLDGSDVREGTGYVTADHAIWSATRDMASKRVPFYALVTHKMFRAIHVVRLLDEDEAKAIMRRARQQRDDAEWETAAPTQAPDPT